jgi:hypothetical protein
MSSLPVTDEAPPYSTDFPNSFPLSPVAAMLQGYAGLCDKGMHEHSIFPELHLWFLCVIN